MSPWWSKSSSKKVKKKSSKESFIDSIQRKFKNASESKFNSRSKVSQRRSDIVSEKGSQSPVGSQSLSTSTLVSRCHSFAERPHAQPLPLPEVHLIRIRGLDSGNGPSAKPASDTGSKPLLMLPPPNQRHFPNVPCHADAEGDLGTDSVSSGSSTDSDDPSDSRLLSPQASDYENGNKASMNSPGANHRDQSPITTQKKSREKFKPAGILLNNPILPMSPKHSPSSRHVPSLQIHQYGAFFSAPDSSLSSPSRSPMRAFGPEPVLNTGFWAGRPCADVVLNGSGQCSSPGSGQNSGHNSIGGDMSTQLFWQHSRCSPECSPIPSPRMISPGPSSRIQSGSVTPLHPRAGGSASESSANWPDDAVNGKQQSHRLPLPPLTISNTGPFSPSYSTGTTPTVPRSPGRTDNSTSPGSRWKKGRLLGRGTFGHVYLGFNSESGEMCAMKEVTLFADDAKSKESAQQLGQEIALLSRLRHPNIVQYYGSETVDDKLYIYLEYVSGGSIYKLLQDYGQLGEIAIRSYTHQILSGLSYLHGKNTVHRDIKGANILVDPNGRVKLADFGMAKHISGQACPLSFKGSPYWMAPEVINNSNGCNLAVDIWSLGCTVLEMATTKPPWSQYEGVAALFKVGNSKELPTIPEHLSDDGKDFILKCLQRNPLHRPTAVQLLEHPFVKNISPSERLIPRPEPTEAVPVITNAVRSMGIGQARNVSCLDSEGLSGHHTRGPKSGSGFSDSLMQRNYISCPVSPMGSPLLHARSPQHTNGRMSPPLISSPHAISGSSTPLTGAVGAIPSYQQIRKQQPTTYLQDGTIGKPRSPNGFYPNSGSSYQDLKPNIFPKVPQGSPFFQEMIPPENGFLGNQLGRPLHQVDHLKETHNGQLVLADRVSQQLLKDHMKLNLSIDLNPSGAWPKD